MTVPSRLWMRAKQLFGGVRAFVGEAESQFRETLGVTTVIALDTFCVTSFMGTWATELARRWQSEIASAARRDAVGIVTQFPATCAHTCFLVVVWTFFVMRWLRFMRWQRWWALPCVFLILCPGAWFLAQGVRRGVDVLTLLVVQSPIIVSSIWRSRALAKRDSSHQ
jgi:hypothetical protein